MKIKLTNIPFLKLRWYAASFSLILIVGTVYLLYTLPEGKKYGVDFIGGVEAIASFEKPINTAIVRSQLEKAGISDPVIQNFHSLEGDSQNLFSIRMKSEERANLSQFIQQALAEGLEDNRVSIEKFDHVGPSIGDQIRQDALLAVIFSLLGITIYISMRFEFRFALGALIGLAHVTLVSLGACLLVGREINAVVFAGILTIVGYSINDTIVVFDRIRENLVNNIKNKKNLAFGEVIDQSINETMSRTIITILTCVFVVLSMYLIGGGALESLAFVLLVGFTMGGYTTVFVACPAVYWLDGFLSKKA